MITAETGGTGQRLGSAMARMLAALALVLVAASPEAFAAGKKAVPAAPVQVPLPRLAPQPAADSVPVPAPAADPGDSAGPDDAIAALIAEAPDESRAAEDSDAPQAVDTAEPDAATPPPPNLAPASPSALNSAGLKLALKFLDNGDPAAATVAAYALPDPVDIKIVDWLVATSGSDAVPASRILAISKKLRDWPGQGLLRLRYEQAVAREDLAPADVIKALGGSSPSSDSATVALTQAYVASGRQKDAAALIRSFWRTEDLSQANERTVLSRFGDLLTAADHKARMDRLLYDGRSDEALRVAALLGKDQIALAKAVISTIKSRKTAYKELTALPRSVRNDPLALYSRVQALRRADKTDDAANLILSAPRDAGKLVDPDAWWIERRLISRALIENGKAKLAYRVAAGHSGESATYRAEAEFHAGWYALEFLHDPATAARHFAEIATISTMPLSLSRAEYWMGRAAAAAGDKAGAAAHFSRRRLSNHLLRTIGAGPAGQYPAEPVAAPGARRRHTRPLRQSRTGQGHSAPRNGRTGKLRRAVLSPPRRHAERPGGNRAAGRHGREGRPVSDRSPDRQDRGSARHAGRNPGFPDLGDSPPRRRPQRSRNPWSTPSPGRKAPSIRRRSAAPAPVACFSSCRPPRARSPRILACLTRRRA